uniref:Collagen alpha-1(XII) chain n=1 Tax=Magallana gigas TaxID=29159 RepID=K1R0L2_MAGGI
MKFEGTVFVGCFVLVCVSAVYKDVVYVMDRSGSVKEADFDESVDFVYNVTEYLAIGTSEMQVSIVIFSSSHSEEFDLNDFTTKADLLNAIKNLRGTRTTGKTYTYDAIDYVRENSFSSAKGGRSGANRTVVILTDGLSNNFTRTVTAADELRAGLGAEVFAIGIGSTVSKSNDELKGIASDPDSYYAISHPRPNRVDLQRRCLCLLPGNTAAIAAGAALGALAAATTLIVSASLLRRWHLSTKEDPMVLAAVGQYQQAPIGPSKASFSFA